MTIKQFIEELTDQSTKENMDNYRQLRHALYVRVIRSPKRNNPAVIIITNTPF